MRDKKLLMITTLVCLLPLILSIIIYDRLPEQIGVHFNSFGETDGWLPKPAAAFGMPIFFALINLVVHFTMDNDPKKANVAGALKILSKWLVPLLSVVIGPLTLFKSMGMEIPIAMIASILVGVVLIAVGNYLPKSRQSYVVGIKIPWTLESEENWKRTHHLAGYVWMIGGVLTIFGAFLKFPAAATIVLVVLIVTIPFFYSYSLYRKETK